MAQELSLSLTLNYAKNGLTITKAYDSLLDVVGNYNMTGVLTIGATQETIPLGDIAPNLGYTFIRNIDQAANLQIGGRTDKPILMTPGEWMIAPFTGVEIMAMAVGGTSCLMEYATFSVATISIGAPPPPP